MIQSYGPHKVTNASIDSILVDQMLAGEKVQILYSDPPWGDGNIRYWATMNKKMTGAENKPLTYDQLLQRLLQLIDDYVDGHVFIETGPRWATMVAAKLSQRLHGVEVQSMKYMSGSEEYECMLVSGTTSPRDFRAMRVAGMLGYQVVQAMVGSVAQPGGLVLDPCCGMGYTARAAIEHKMFFRGNEINAARLAKTINRLRADK